MNVQSNDRTQTPNNHAADPGERDPRQMRLKVGAKLAGVFVLKEPIISDAANPVWLAEDELLGKDVALHFLPPALAGDEQRLKALSQEIKRTRQLVHPHILRVYDLVTDGELVAISTERFKGDLISAVLAERPGQYFEPADAKPLLRQICQTLADAHRISAVHGNLTLENIIITPSERVIVRGFGTSRVASGDTASSISPADDVRGFAAVIYQMLTGLSPERSSDDQAMVSMMEARTRANRRGGTILPVWEKLIASALTGTPADAPASVTDFGERLGLMEKRGGRQVIPNSGNQEPEQPAAQTSAQPDVVEAKVPTRESTSTLAGGPKRVGVQARKPWIPEAKLASADDLPFDDIAEPDVSYLGPSTTFTPTLPKRTKRILRIVGVLFLLALIAIGVGVSQWLRNGNAGVRTAQAPQTPATATSKSETTESQKETPDLSSAGSLEERIRQQEEALREAEQAANDAQRLAEEKSRAVGDARAALAALRGTTSSENAPSPQQAATRSDSLVSDLPQSDPKVTQVQPNSLLDVSPASSPMLGAGTDERGVQLPSAKDESDPPNPDAAYLETGNPADWPRHETVPANAAVASSNAKDPETVSAESIENSLGMKFVRVGEVQFCIWPTRVQDYAAYAQDVRLKSTAWRQPGFKQGPDHPVIRISWNHAVAFCDWLTKRERAAGKLSEGEVYRLPKDEEWSAAVGLSDETGKDPSERSGKITNIYPWGEEWPPKEGAGNYNGQETGLGDAITGYQDGFVRTSPVGTFPANRNGIYDLGGNVWEWCADFWKKGSTARVLRGASYLDGAKRELLLSSTRLHVEPNSMTYHYGFRVVRAPAPPPRKRP